MAKNPIPNPGFVQILKPGLLLTVSWHRMQSGSTIWYKAEAGVCETEWISEELSIVATNQNDAIVEGAWKGIDLTMPALWDEIGLSRNDLSTESQLNSHPTTFGGTPTAETEKKSSHIDLHQPIG